MDIEKLEEALRDARRAMSAADMTASRAINHAAGRLRALDISQDTLRALKAELRAFNAHTGRWNPRR